MSAASSSSPVASQAAPIETGHFARAPMAPADAIFGLNNAFKEDTSDKKLNLGVGAYRTEEGKPWVLSCVQEAEKIILEQQARGALDKEYLPIDGYPALKKVSAELVFGKALVQSFGERLQNVQAVSGTGALRLGFEFVKRFMGPTPNEAPLILVPNPTWANHQKIIQHAGLSLKQYRYLNYKSLELDIEGLLQDLKSAPDGSVVLLHSCAHNPTGVDPSIAQWQTIADVCIAKKHFAYFDSAYQGFASGDLEKDSLSIRLFAEQGIPLFVAQSYSKNFGLYSERIGCLQLLGPTPDQSKASQSQIRDIARGMYSNPPVHGAHIVATVLGDARLTQLWHDELRVMANRINEMRQLLLQALIDRHVPGSWTHITSQIGMFSYTGLTEQQVAHLTKQHHVYLTRDGRISMAGLSKKSIGYLADAIKETLETVKAKF